MRARRFPEGNVLQANPDHKVESVTRSKERSHGPFSSLSLRILAVNLAAPVLLVLGLLFLDEYEDTLIATELEALHTQGELIAASLGESAVVVETENADFPSFIPNGNLRIIQPDTARQLVRRLAGLAQLRARLFDRDGNLIADSRLLQGPGGEVQVIDLPPLAEDKLDQWLRQAYVTATGRFGLGRDLEAYTERGNSVASDYKEVMAALEQGETGDAVRLRADREKMLTVAVPVQFYRQVVGAVFISRDGRNIDKRLFAVRGSILAMFGWVLGLTILTSIYLASTIGRPLRILAEAAEKVRHAKTRRHSIPDMTHRSDEIGELSGALREMTESLWQRLDAIESFAADVAHELKNPLTSLRSAVETVARVKDPEQQKKLMSIILDDVSRLDRLISDISDASRLDAELSRAETGPVKLGALLDALAQMQNANDDTKAPKVNLEIAAAESLTITGLEGRLAQVFRNLIVNAVSFSPPGGTITVRATREGPFACVDVLDQGSGIPAGKEKAIFERFYSERPEAEKFGTHSGLGLSISKQIVEAHRGIISAVNRNDGGGTGARFIVRLPLI
ncbi:MAG: HAMP domain-containing protein [Alphaproteobacteria bacterium]|nr:HAMP domain-containing protein [Alphaproteobacteria bacterium]PHX98776.1 MAG: histidine kinase [Rhodospirillaceae bacterium]